jgi:hypothetical protein
MATSKPLSPAQHEIMELLSARVGQTVDVLCGEPIHSMSADFIRRSIGRTTHAALRGLEARGYIEASYFWRGATVRVLKGLEA